MCAISGMIDLTAEDTVIQRMLSTMHRRGPDEQGIYRDEDALLLHTRLAIVDLDGGRQPMSLTWNGITYTIVYNGELYNTEELRHTLNRLGHSFSGHSDTEVVLHAYAEYSSACVNHLNGIFSFAVWEKERKRLFLARDRIGVKPLFYKYHLGGLAFASEMKTILAVPGVKAQLDENGAAQLILLGPGRIPGSGIFKDLLELEPGCCGYYEAGKLAVNRYWKLTDREHADSFEETSECVRYLVTDAIRRQLVSDVPIGTFLSGGLDSSIIAAVCAQELSERGSVLPTFSVDYENQDQYFQTNKFQPTSDSAYIYLMVEALKTSHQWTVLSAQNLLDALEAATLARDLPGMADVDFSLLAFSGEIRKKVKVALSGECADEIFGGYPWYRDREIRERAGFPWAQNTAQRASVLSPRIQLNASDFVMDAYHQTVAESDILPQTSAEDRRMKEMVNLNFRWFMQTLLDRKDRMSMYHGLEVRVPFCDYRIAQYLYSVPWAFKDYQNREKGLLRHAMEGLLPKEVLYRKKSPYPKTFDPDYELAVRSRLEELMEEDTPLWYLTQKNAVRRIVTEDSPWPWYGQLMRKPQTAAWFLQLDFWLKHYRVELCF